MMIHNPSRVFSRVFSRASSLPTTLCRGVTLAQTSPVGTLPSSFDLVKNAEFLQSISPLVLDDSAGGQQ